LLGKRENQRNKNRILPQNKKNTGGKERETGKEIAKQSRLLL
jgi:hypothetical protein